MHQSNWHGIMFVENSFDMHETKTMYIWPNEEAIKMIFLTNP